MAKYGHKNVKIISIENLNAIIVIFTLIYEYIWCKDENHICFRAVPSTDLLCKAQSGENNVYCTKKKKKREGNF